MKASESIPIRLLTHNIRYATSSPFKGEEVWEIRRPRLLNELLFHTLYNPEAFICLQEVLHKQLFDILDDLNKGTVVDEWAYIGVGRDDGKMAGEYSPIFFRPSVWKLEYFETLWLSETPNQPSKGWDAASIRILTIGEFQHRQSKKKVVAMNTHLDDQGSISRLHSAEMIKAKILNSPITRDIGGPLPVFLAGDLNSEPTQEAYQILESVDSPVQDAMGMAPQRTYGHSNTFTGFGYEKEPPKRIDFLFVGPKGTDAWGIRSYAVLESRFEDGVYNSDHRAVVGDFLLEV